MLMKDEAKSGVVNKTTVAAVLPPSPVTPEVAKKAGDELLAMVARMGRLEYVQGFKRATKVIAMAVGQLDGDARAKIAACLDQLELELEDAERKTR